MRILIADDHALMRAGLVHLLGQADGIEVAGEASHGAQVLDRLGQGGIDLLLLDLFMPGLSGLELIARIRAAHGYVPVVVLSMSEDPDLAQRVLQAGARGYLTKDIDPALLLSGLRKVADGGRTLSPGIAEALVFEAAQPDDPRTLLSPRELQVMELLGKGARVNEIARQLDISHKTVSTHKSKLMEKMGFASLVDLLRYSLQRGPR